MVVHPSDLSFYSYAVAFILFYCRANTGGNAIFLLVSNVVGYYQCSFNGSRIFRYEAKIRERRSHYEY